MNLALTKDFNPVVARATRGEVRTALLVSLDSGMFCGLDDLPRGRALDWSGPKRMELSLWLHGIIRTTLYFSYEDREQAVTAFARLSDCQADWFMSDEAYFMRLRALAPSLGAAVLEDS